MKALILSLATLAVAVAPPAQNTHVSPAGFQMQEGKGSNSWPFTRLHPQFSYMQVHSDLPVQPARITEIAFRRDGLVPLPTIPAHTFTLSLSLSTGSLTATTATDDFTGNHGPDLTKVLDRVTINVPAATLPVSPPAPFHLQLNFANRPFLYKGRSIGPLVWDLRIHANTLTVLAPLDATVSMESTYTRLGMGGTAGGQTRASEHLGLVEADPNLPTNQILWCRAHYLPPMQVYAWMIGIDDRRLGSLALPIDLSFLGLPGNHLYIAPMITLTGTTDSNGDVDTSKSGYLSFPADPALAGVDLFTQIAAADPLGKGYPLVMTDYCRISFPRHINACRIFAGGDDLAIKGQLDHTSVLVTRFTYQ